VNYNVGIPNIPVETNVGYNVGIPKIPVETNVGYNVETKKIPAETNVHRVFDEVKLLFVNVYLPYEDAVDSHEDFGLQLSIAYDFIERNSRCMAYVGAILMWTLTGIGFILRC
jgi:hypothetical protein